MSDGPRIQQGWRVDATTPDDLANALEAIVDYRGDVTITRSGGAPVVGYVFDGQVEGSGREDGGRVRLLPADGGSAVVVPLVEITAIEVTGRDTAAGKSFQTWVKKYIERKLAGKPANIENEGECDACESS